MSERAHVSGGVERTGNPLFWKKPMDWLLNEAKATGEHTLKRTLGPVSLTALGVGAIIGAGIFVLSGLGAHYAGPGLMLSFVISGFGCAFAGLCYAEFAALIPLAGSAYTYAYAALGELFAWIIGWDLTLEYAMGASTVSSGWSNHFIEFLDIFGIHMPLWLSYDHWTAMRTAENMIARQMAAASDSESRAWLASVFGKGRRHSQRAIAGVDPASARPGKRSALFGMEIGFNLPAFLIALVITAILVRGIQESASFNAVIVFIKVAVVLFIIVLGIHYINFSNWGHDWTTFAPMGFGVSAQAQRTSSSPTSDLTLYPRLRRKRKIRSAISRSESSRRSWFARFCTFCGGRPHRNGSVEGNQYRSAAGRCLPRSRTYEGFVPNHIRCAGWPHERHARHVARPDARALLDGE